MYFWGLLSWPLYDTSKPESPAEVLSLVNKRIQEWNQREAHRQLCWSLKPKHLGRQLLYLSSCPTEEDGKEEEKAIPFKAATEVRYVANKQPHGKLMLFRKM